MLYFNILVDEINTRLKHMRSYTRELAKFKASVKSGASADEIYKSKWAYFETLDAFLRSQITPRKSMTNLVSFRPYPIAMEPVH